MAPANLPATAARSTLAQQIIALGVLFAFLYWASNIVMAVMLSVLLAYFLDPVVVLLERIHIPRYVGALIVLLVAAAAFTALGYLAVNRMQAFAEAWPRYSAAIQRAVQAVNRSLANIERQVLQPGPANRQPQTGGATGRGDDGQQLGSLLLRGIGSITSGLFVWAFLPFLVLFMLAGKAKLWRATLGFFPDSSRANAKHALDEVNVVLRSYVVGTSAVAAILIVACWIFFWLMHLDYPFVTGLIAGLANLIPYIGLLLAWIPPFLIGLGQWHSVGPFIAIAGVLSAFHLLAGNLLMPAIVGRQVHLNALSVTLALLFWGWMWGALGLILAIPITATIKVICDHVPELQPVGRWLAA